MINNNRNIESQNIIKQLEIIKKENIDDNGEKKIHFSYYFIISNGDRINALHLAVMKANIGQIKELLLNNFDPNSKTYFGFKPIDFTINHTDIKAITLLFPQTHNIFDNRQIGNCNLLHMAIIKNNLIIVKYLLNNNAPLNKKDNIDQSTALHIAVNRRYNNIALELIKYRANPNIKNIFFHTPISIAINTKNLDLIKPLLNADNIDINQKDQNNDSLLHMACINNLEECIELIIKKDLEKNESKNSLLISKNNDNETPLDLLIFRYIKSFNGNYKLKDQFAFMNKIIEVKNIMIYLNAIKERLLHQKFHKYINLIYENNKWLLDINKDEINKLSDLIKSFINFKQRNTFNPKDHNHFYQMDYT